MNLPTYHDLENSQKDSRRCQTTSKLFAAVAVVLGLAAIAGLCAVVAVTLPMAYNTGSSAAESNAEELEDKERLHSMVRLSIGYS